MQRMKRTTVLCGVERECTNELETSTSLRRKELTSFLNQKRAAHERFYHTGCNEKESHDGPLAKMHRQKSGSPH